MGSFLTGIVLLLVGGLAAYSARWAVRYFGLSSFSQIIYHIKVPLEGTNPQVLEDWMKMCLMPSAIYMMLVTVAFGLVYQPRPYLIFSLIMFALFIIYAVIRVGLPSYLSAQSHTSTLYEDHFVTAKDVKIENKSKRNLIHIYLESMENTHMSKELGGDSEVNLIPELSKLALDNISFSNTELMGGALQVTSTGWTTAGMVASSGGVPINQSFNAKKYTGNNPFMPGITSISDILADQGYNQAFLCGSDVKFGGRAAFYQQHGNVKLYDWISAQESGDIPKDYRAFWGFEDQKLFAIAKKRISELAAEDKPFNFTMLTIDTHHPYGYKCSLCQDTYDNEMANILACNSAQVGLFIDWLKQQPFYDNTTIVLCGDHLSMAAEFIDSYYDKHYLRTTYNCFINSVVTPSQMKKRQFTTFDLFPSILESMGVSIEGHRLGLGTSLFSEEKTLTETYGYEWLNSEVAKKNKFYNEHIL